MDLSFLIFTVLILFCVGVMYYYFAYNRTTLYGNQILLNAATPSIMLTPITNNPNSLNYTIGLWVFIISWPMDGNFNTLFNMNTAPSSQASTATSKYMNNGACSNYVLYLDKTTPNLYLSVPSGNRTSDGSRLSGDILITNNFPIQSWAYIALSMNGNQGDFYMNGKLVASKNLTSNVSVSAPGSQMELGVPKSNGMTSGFATTTPNMYIANVQRMPTSSTPQDVWTSYLAGNGVSNSNPSSYGLALGLKQNGTVISSYNVN